VAGELRIILITAEIRSYSNENQIFSEESIGQPNVYYFFIGRDKPG